MERLALCSPLFAISNKDFIGQALVLIAKPDETSSLFPPEP